MSYRAQLTGRALTLGSPPRQSVRSLDVRVRPVRSVVAAYAVIMPRMMRGRPTPGAPPSDAGALLSELENLIPTSKMTAGRAGDDATLANELALVLAAALRGEDGSSSLGKVDQNELRTAIEHIRRLRVPGDAAPAPAVCPKVACPTCPAPDPIACADIIQCGVCPPPTSCPVVQPTDLIKKPAIGGSGVPLGDDSSDTPRTTVPVVAVVNGAAAANMDVMPAVNWTRSRILAFQRSVMEGGSLGSRMPGHTQMEPYDADTAFRDTGELAGKGVLLQPFYMFSGRYGVRVTAEMRAWIDANVDGKAPPPLPLAAFAAPAATGDATPGARSPFAAAPVSPWSPGAGIVEWRVAVPDTLAPSADTPFSALSTAPGASWHASSALFNPWAHTRAVAQCPLRQMPVGPSVAPLPLFLDLETSITSLVNERRYPLLSPLLQAGGKDDAAMAKALFRSEAAQPVPGVATMFNVVIGQTGYIFTRPMGSGRRVGLPDGQNNDPAGEAWRPIQCLYRWD